MFIPQEFIYHGGAFILYLIASAILLIEVSNDKYNSHYRTPYTVISVSKKKKKLIALVLKLSVPGILSSFPESDSSTSSIEKKTCLKNNLNKIDQTILALKSIYLRPELLNAPWKYWEAKSLSVYISN